MTIWRAPALLLFSLLTPAVLAAQITSPHGPRRVIPDPVAVEGLEEALRQLLRDEAMRDVRFGFALRDLASGEMLCEHRANEGYITASNMKLISSAVALRTLGPEFRFETRLVGVGAQKGTVFEGDLVLVGSGDPTLGATVFEKEGVTAPFRRMAVALAKAGIREVRGRVLGDDDAHAEELMGHGWDWSYHADWYAAQIGGLCFNENCIDVVLDAGASGSKPRVRLEPDTSYVTLRNDLTTAREASKARGVHLEPRARWQPHRAERQPRAEHQEQARLGERPQPHGLRGDGVARDPRERGHPRAWRRLRPRRGPRRAPGACGGQDRLGRASFARAAEDRAIRSTSAAKTSTPSSSCAPPPPRPGVRGPMSVAAKHAKEVLRDSSASTRSAMVLADGSGLSRLNLVKPRQLVALLAGMHASEHREDYVASLPVAGVDGTLRRRFGGENPARGRVRAKTGYVSRTVALSGYVPRRGKAPLAFSILVNDFVGPSSRIKALVDAFVGQICVAAGRLNPARRFD